MTKPAETKRPTRVLHSISLAADPVLMSDGTLWSHAATLGTRYQGDTFTIDQSAVDNFVKVFSSGYPQKIPVDYEHGSTSADPEIRKARAQGNVPKAGDVLELRGVYSQAGFTGDLKTAAEKLAAQAGRPLDDPRNYGLWMRWKPTARALAAVKAGEYTELSIAFTEDMPHNTNGEGQGPGLWAVALLNTPFLDDMLPVAASRIASDDDDRVPADPATKPREERMTKLTVLSVAAAVLGRAIASEDEALNELSGLGDQLKELKTARELRDVVAAEFDGEKDPTKLVAKVRDLKASVATATAAAAEQKKAAIKTTVDATMKEYESKLTVPLKELMARGLTKELEDGKKVEESETVKALKSLPSSNITRQFAGGDVGGANADDDVKVDARAKELMRTDPELIALAKTSHQDAYKRALIIADEELASVAK